MSQKSLAQRGTCTLGMRVTNTEFRPNSAPPPQTDEVQEFLKTQPYVSIELGEEARGRGLCDST